MKTIDHAEIRQLFDDYLRQYASRDDRLTEFFSEDFSGITGSGDELTKNLDEWIAITRKDFAQVKDPLRIELKDLVTQSLSDTIAVATSAFTIHLPIKDHILSRKTARLVLIFRKESAGWKICHSSISIPFAMAQEGEVYPLQEIEERNKLLEELVAERTRELSAAKIAADAASIAKSQFLATMSHEIRTPLNALVGFSTLARKSTDPEKISQYLSILEQSSRSLMDLVNNILDMSKIEAGRLEFEAVPVNLRQFASSLEGQYRHLAHQKKLEFRVSVADDVPRWVLGDPVRLRQTLANLLSNAVKFTENGEVTCSISRIEKNSEQFVRFEVRDSGIGFPDSFLPVLFEPFRQLDPTISRRFGGTGLGLAIVHSLVEMMKGTIAVDSREGGGSCFVVDLPLQETEQPAEELLATPVKLEPCAILVVEDNGFNRQLLGDILSSWGHRVTLAESGQQALLLMEQHPFDLILLDIRMPGIDGIEVARRIRAEEQERPETVVPIIAITADIDAATREACHTAGINTVLSKPVIPEQLARAIAEQCEGMGDSSPDQEPLLNQRALAGLSDNPESIRSFQKMLLTDIDHELRCLHTSLEQGDRQGLGRTAHTLKGLYGYLTDHQPVELTDWLQSHAQSAPFEELQQVVEQLRTVS